MDIEPELLGRASSSSHGTARLVLLWTCPAELWSRRQWLPPRKGSANVSIVADGLLSPLDAWAAAARVMLSLWWSMYSRDVSAEVIPNSWPKVS